MNHNLRHRSRPSQASRPLPRRSRPPVSPDRRARTPQPKRRRPPEPRQPWQPFVGAIAAFCGGTAVLVIGLSISVRLIVDPQSVAWLQPFLPAWSQVPIATKEPPQTLSQIEAAIAEAGLIPGEIIPLDRPARTNPDTEDRGFLGRSRAPVRNGILLPVLETFSCPENGAKSDCQKFVALRMYQPVFNSSEPHSQQISYQLMAELTVAGPEKSFLLASLDENDTPDEGANEVLALTELKSFDGPVPNNGLWFNLVGERQIGDRSVTYGQIVHYNPISAHFSMMLQWNSPGGHFPVWENVTGDTQAELMLDRGVGMEPQVSIYQLTPVEFFLNPIQLDEISLREPALSAQGYKDALLLANNGLWTPAGQLMEAIKRDRLTPEDWPATAQAQLDLIRYHATIAQKQARADWPNPTDKIRIALLDGAWKQALDLSESQFKQGDRLSSLLEDPRQRLWQRVETAVRVNPAQTEAKIWGTLLVAAREGEAAGISWFDAQPQATPESRDRALQVLELYGKAAAYAENLRYHRSQLFGSATVLTATQPGEWLKPANTASLELLPGEIWYRIRLRGFHDSLGWRQAPFTDLDRINPGTLETLWQELGLHTDPDLVVALWGSNGEQQSTIATVKAVRANDGELTLLAAGSPLSGMGTGRGSGSNALAFSSSVIEWRSPETQTLAQLYQSDPEWVRTLLPTLWVELQSAGQLPPQAVPSLEQMLKQLGGWLVQSIDLTANGWPEAVFTLRSDALLPSSTVSGTETTPYRTRTIVFDDKGTLIYSELTTAAQQAVTGIAEVARGGLALVVESPDGYTLQRWSSSRERFEF
jgi:pimeloyl-ACP methyl ester carboxylesterase